MANGARSPNAHATATVGQQKKTYSIFRPAKGSGEQCEAKHGQVVENECNTHKCERECLGVWNKHTGCIVSAKNFADPDLKCTGEKIERFDLIPPQIEKHIGCSLPTVGGDIFDTYEGEKDGLNVYFAIPANVSRRLKSKSFLTTTGIAMTTTTTMPTTRRTRAYRKCAEVKEEEVVVVA